jgi:hypothetical protein
MLIFDDTGHAVTCHRDHAEQSVCHEFIWFRSNLNKQLYTYNKKTKKKKYISSYSAWFDTVNQLHGAHNSSGLSFSIRVDGIFTDELRANIPKPSINLASTPALWAISD